MLKHFLCCLLICPTLAFSQSTIENTGSNLSKEDAQAVLNLHNKVRADLGIPPLTWSPTVAAFAQLWADSLANFNDCNIKHHSNEFGYGENIFGGSSAELFKGIDAAKAWLEEKGKYTYSKLGEGNWFETGHYTQMIWKTTTEVGLGMATCPSGGVVVVGNYNPSGNMSGEYPY
jgi:pathogenesis-related protein 1